MKKSLLFLFSLLILSCGVQKSAKKHALELANAIKTHNYELNLKYTHPEVIKMLGGEKKYIDILKTGGKEMKRMGISYESIELGKPTKPVKAGNELHCLVPETITMKLREGKMVSKSHLLAVSKDNGKTWTFIETMVLDGINIKKLFPDYNPALKIPKPEQPKHIK